MFDHPYPQQIGEILTTSSTTLPRRDQLVPQAPEPLLQILVREPVLVKVKIHGLREFFLVVEMRTDIIIQQLEGSRETRPPPDLSAPSTWLTMSIKTLWSKSIAAFPTLILPSKTSPSCPSRNRITTIFMRRRAQKLLPFHAIPPICRYAYVFRGSSRSHPALIRADAHQPHAWGVLPTTC